MNSQLNKTLSVYLFKLIYIFNLINVNDESMTIHSQSKSIFI